MKRILVRHVIEKLKAYKIKTEFLTSIDDTLLRQPIIGFNNYENARQGELAWISIESLKTGKKSFDGSILVCPPNDRFKNLKKTIVISTENPRLIFTKLTNDFFKNANTIKWKQKNKYNQKRIQIQQKLSVAKGVVIGPNVAMKNNISIGPNTVIANCEIGNNVTIGSNCSIGLPGFGYAKDIDGRYLEFPHVGKVIIGDNVRIGSNTCIDRGGLGNTVIHDGVKIDNLVHVAHNVVIGRNSMVIANTMIGGSVVIEKDTWIAPSASIMNKTKIGQKAIVGLGAVVLKDVKADSVVAGNPGRVIRKTNKNKK